jgi:ubiquinone/menaquinone biosynthesis C-methylase UbiE
LPQVDEEAAVKFFDRFIGAKGPIGWYSRYIVNTGRWYTNLLIEQGEITASDKILDIGCGSASTLINLAKAIDFETPLIGIEPSNEQIKLAKRDINEANLNDKIVIRQSFACPLDFPDQSFDLVYLSFVIKHFTDETLNNCLREIYRVLKLDGNIVGWEFSYITNPVYRRLAKPRHAMQKFRSYAEINSFLSKNGFSKITQFQVPDRGFWDPVKNVGFKAKKLK